MAVQLDRPLQRANAENSTSVAKLQMNEAEAAARLDISARTLWELRKAGKIAFVRVGTTGIRYTEKQLQAYIDANTVATVSNG